MIEAAATNPPRSHPPSYSAALVEQHDAPPPFLQYGYCRQTGHASANDETGWGHTGQVLDVDGGFGSGRATGR